MLPTEAIPHGAMENAIKSGCEIIVIVVTRVETKKIEEGLHVLAPLLLCVCKPSTKSYLK